MWLRDNNDVFMALSGQQFKTLSTKIIHTKYIQFQLVTIPVNFKDHK